MIKVVGNGLRGGRWKQKENRKQKKTGKRPNGQPKQAGLSGIPSQTKQGRVSRTKQDYEQDKQDPVGNKCGL